tara:strand:+ start:2224 stop:2865 length:642 start_codon:yes stop_codon:yes gene_type:complete
MKFKFDIVAKYYNTLEILAFGKILYGTRLCFLTRSSNPINILLVGEGTGCFLKCLANCNPKSSITVIDSSKRMIKVIHECNYTTKVEDITILHQDYFNYSPIIKYDLIYTNFFLDCFKSADVLKIVGNIKSMLNETGEWNDVDFTKPNVSNLLNYTYNKLILNVLYKSFRLICKIESVSIKDVDFNHQKLGFILDREMIYQFPPVRVRRYKLA